MYSPVKDGIKKAITEVEYIEIAPPIHLSNLVHCYWELKTHIHLSQNFSLEAIPDACVNIFFNMHNTSVAAVTMLDTKTKSLNLWKMFHYVGIQFVPWVWRGEYKEIRKEYVDNSYGGPLDLIEVAQKLVKVDFKKKQEIFTMYVEYLYQKGIISENKVILKILRHLNEIKRVSDMAKFSGFSTRHLLRIFKESIHLSPSEFLKIVRFQKSLRWSYLSHYTDQAHFIHSFKDITGKTPKRFLENFYVR
jgi:AraC-like DNA-binding protein